MCQLGNGAGKSDSETKITGGDSIAGQIVSFMENLHLSYGEVFEELPYILLLVMSADKLRVVYDKEDEIEMVSGRELMEQKRGLIIKQSQN